MNARPDRTRNARARRHRQRRRDGKMVIKILVPLDFYSAAQMNGWITTDDLENADELAEKLGRAVDYKLGVEEPGEVTRYAFEDFDVLE